ncbi:RNA polymerase factor sigma-54 [Parablastomonas sp. CN1-191]|uniref:RNA polymerase factor sigma-54 n=1 Tax=Parablastomonas sp. CN1-191 TaxID=3400908 RepID=UPI003BF77819
MTLAPRLDLRQSQSLVMTPQLQQAIKLLALSNLELEGVLADAAAANPLLEVGGGEAEASDSDAPEARRTTLESSPVDQLIGEGRVDEDRPLDWDGAAAREAESGDWSAELRMAAAADAPDAGERGGGTTLADHLHAQVAAERGDAATKALAHALADQLDEAGYLPLPLGEALPGAEPAEAEAALALLQRLDPAGVGARSLSECLALQAKDADRYDPCMARLIYNLDLVARGEFARLRRMCDVDDEDFADMLAELRGYDPKPGLRFGASDGEAVTPDVLVHPRADGGWDIELNQATLPRLVVNRSYYVELKGACDDKAGRAWLSDKLADANWLVKALDQRARTILKVASEVVKRQDGYFRHGVSQLRPLTLRTVAEAVALHESTVSRVTSNKYLACPRGTRELKFFFTSGVASAGSSEGAAAEAVKAAIRKLIDAEDPKAILSDDALVDLLKAQGFDLARRTVAKYREAIGLGSSVQRRRHKALVGAR